MSTTTRRRKRSTQPDATGYDSAEHDGWHSPTSLDPDPCDGRSGRENGYSRVARFLGELRLKRGST